MARSTVLATLLVAAIAAGSSPALAQAARMVTGEPLPAEQMADMLFPEAGVKTRSLVLGAPPAKPAAIGYPIQFEFDSAEVTEGSRRYLDEVGRMMKLERLEGRHLRVEGHTDATGSDGYNRTLSERRARAVAAYLTTHHDVSASSLVVVGKGEGDPLPERSADDPLNRRVVFSAAQ